MNNQYTHEQQSDVQAPADNPPLVLFDGVCNLCSATIQFIVRYDQQKQFYFSALQSQPGQKITAQTGDNQLDSVLLYYNNRIYRKSSAALHILKLLGGFWSLGYFFIIIPTPVRDWVYDFVGKHRYRWFGKKKACWLPDESLQQRFLDAETAKGWIKK